MRVCNEIWGRGGAVVYNILRQDFYFANTGIKYFAQKLFELSLFFFDFGRQCPVPAVAALVAAALLKLAPKQKLPAAKARAKPKGEQKAKPKARGKRKSAEEKAQTDADRAVAF